MGRRKVILIGLDGLVPEQVERYSGRVPELDGLLRGGFFSPAIPSAVTDTPTNWTTIATGAWMGTHGIIGFEDHLPGMAAGRLDPPSTPASAGPSTSGRPRSAREGAASSSTTPRRSHSPSGTAL